MTQTPHLTYSYTHSFHPIHICLLTEHRREIIYTIPFRHSPEADLSLSLSLSPHLRGAHMWRPRPLSDANAALLSDHRRSIGRHQSRRFREQPIPAMMGRGIGGAGGGAGGGSGSGGSAGLLPRSAAAPRRRRLAAAATGVGTAEEEEEEEAPPAPSSVLPDDCSPSALRERRRLRIMARAAPRDWGEGGGGGGAMDGPRGRGTELPRTAAGPASSSPRGGSGGSGGGRASSSEPTAASDNSDSWNDLMSGSWFGAGSGPDEGTADGTAGGGRQALKVVVYEAQGLPDIQLFGTQDPYVRVSLVYEGEASAAQNEGAASVRCCAVDSGGTDPSWVRLDSKVEGATAETGSVLRLPLSPELHSAIQEESSPPRMCSLLLEIWNENAMTDDEIIGSTRLRLTAGGLGTASVAFVEIGNTKWYDLDHGGRVRCHVGL